jgi:subtilisin family serine protease
MTTSLNQSADAQADAAMETWFAERCAGLSGAGVKIAVVDSGWRRDWPYPAICRGINISSSRIESLVDTHSATDDSLGHGSCCTLLLKEIAPRAEILPIKIFDRLLETSPSVVTAAVDLAVERGVDIVNLSLSTRSLAGMRDLYAACARATAAGTIVIASGDMNLGGYPASFDNVLGVAGIRLRGRLAYGRSPSLTLDFSANSRTHVTLPTPRRERREVSGSTFAAPVIAGIVSLLREANCAKSLRDTVTWLDANVPRFFSGK